MRGLSSNVFVLDSLSSHVSPGNKSNDSRSDNKCGNDDQHNVLWRKTVADSAIDTSEGGSGANTHSVSRFSGLTSSSVLFGTFLSARAVKPNTVRVVDDIGGSSNKPYFRFIRGDIQLKDVGSIAVIKVTVFELVAGGSRELILGSIDIREVFTRVRSSARPQWMRPVDHNFPVLPKTSSRSGDAHLVLVGGLIGDDVVWDSATRTSSVVVLGTIFRGIGDVEVRDLNGRGNGEIPQSNAWVVDDRGDTIRIGGMFWVSLKSDFECNIGRSRS